MFKKIRRHSAITRLLEEQLYEQVAIELRNGHRRDGLWTKALSNSSGIEEKAKALYIEYRVQSLKDEIELTTAIEEEVENRKKSTSPDVSRRKKIIQKEATNAPRKATSTPPPKNTPTATSTSSKTSNSRKEDSTKASSSSGFDPDDYEWFVSAGEREFGPRTTEEIIKMIEQGKITRKSFIRNSTMNVREPITETYFVVFMNSDTNQLSESQQMLLLCIKCQRKFESDKKYCGFCRSSDFVVEQW
ncbi:MAG: DUF4339 domain-containing protein [Desulfuromonadaceae bacterium]|nr:DUF4339 domain-containing protein [Desulfuromonadaceae bacterium]